MVTGIMITNNVVNDDCYESFVSQSLTDYHTILSVLPSDSTKRKEENIITHLNRIKKMVLASDSEYFLFVDSDVKIPLNTAKQLSQHKKDMIGGWVPMRYGKSYAAGKWVADNYLLHYEAPQQSVIKVDYIGFACMMLSRKILTEIDFSPGMDKTCKNSYVKETFLGPCVQFSNDAFSSGYSIYVDGDIVCQHLHDSK